MQKYSGIFAGIETAKNGHKRLQTGEVYGSLSQKPKLPRPSSQSQGEGFNPAAEFGSAHRQHSVLPKEDMECDEPLELQPSCGASLTDDEYSAEGIWEEYSSK